MRRRFAASACDLASDHDGAECRELGADRAADDVELAECMYTAIWIHEAHGNGTYRIELGVLANAAADDDATSRNNACALDVASNIHVARSLDGEPFGHVSIDDDGTERANAPA